MSFTAVNNEIAMADGVYGTNNNNYYLYTNQFYWLGSPNYFDSSNSAGEFIVNSLGGLINGSHYDFGGVRPVVSLLPSVKLLGSGTYNDVYTVS